MPTPIACPSCRQTMEAHTFASKQGPLLTLDICYPCQGMWLDRHENLRLAPQAVLELFRLLHEHRTDERRPLQQGLACPRCVKSLDKGFDVVRSGRYVTYRCAARHGRFSTFSSFMVEKGFVRQLTEPEIKGLAARVGAISCSGCGAPVDIRKDHACPYCRSAFSLLDPDAVVRALEGYAQAGVRRPGGHAPDCAPDVADALITLERERNAARRDKQTAALGGWGADVTQVTVGDLLTAGVALVWGVLKD